MNIVLLEPESPDNVYNIGRTCVVTNSSLHIVYPTPIRLHSKRARRVGLDYWERVDLHTYTDWDDFLLQHGDEQLYFATTKANQTYAAVSYAKDAYLVFGKESAGIPEEILAGRRKQCIRIPMFADNRSLNLSNSVAIILYEALRQQDFAGLTCEGQLHRLEWES